jgi:hypothetical protein
MTIEIAADYALYVLARLLKKRRIALVLEREHITSHMVKEKITACWIASNNDRNTGRFTEANNVSFLYVGYMLAVILEPGAWVLL